MNFVLVVEVKKTQVILVVRITSTVVKMKTVAKIPVGVKMLPTAVGIAMVGVGLKSKIKTSITSLSLI